MHNRVYDPGHALAINLSDFAVGNETIELFRLHSGNGFFFADFPLAGIIDQLAADPEVIVSVLSSNVRL